MPKKAVELPALSVQRITTPGLHAVGGVAGLHLQVTPSGARSWVLRVTIAGKRRDMGLGGFPDVKLADARDAAREARAKIDQGIDPVAARAAARSALVAESGKAVTFDQAVTRFIEAKSGEWTNAKHRQQWQRTLDQYAKPYIGSIFVRDVTLAHVVSILEPIWQTRTETASRVRQRIEKILDWATVRGYRTGENPARWKGHLENVFASPKKVAKPKNQPALPFKSVAEFFVDMRAADGLAIRALEFAILTAARSGEVREMTWGEVDFLDQVWTVPAGRMKAAKEHRVPLSTLAIEVLKAIGPEGKIASDLVFPTNKGTPLSDAAVSAAITRLNDRRVERGLTRWIDPSQKRDVVPHGFRSTFRDWAGETTAYPREVIEHALAHQLQDKAEAAYARGTLFDKRRALMADWAKYCAQKVTK